MPGGLADPPVQLWECWLAVGHCHRLVGTSLRARHRRERPSGWMEGHNTHWDTLSCMLNMRCGSHIFRLNAVYFIPQQLFNFSNGKFGSDRMRQAHWPGSCTSASSAPCPRPSQALDLGPLWVRRPARHLTLDDTITPFHNEQGSQHANKPLW